MQGAKLSLNKTLNWPTWSNLPHWKVGLQNLEAQKPFSNLDHLILCCYFFKSLWFDPLLLLIHLPTLFAPWFQNPKTSESPRLVSHKDWPELLAKDFANCQLFGRAHFANFTIALQTFSQNPQSAGPSIQAKRKKILGLSAFCYLVTMNNNRDFLLGQLSWILGKSELGLHAFCSIPLKSWSRCKSDPSGHYSQNVLSIIKSPVYCFEGLGGLRRLCYKVLLSFEHFIQDKSLKSLKVHLNYIVPAVV